MKKYIEDEMNNMSIRNGYLSKKPLFWLGYILVVFSEVSINIMLIKNYQDIITFIGLLFISLYCIISQNSYRPKTLLILIILFLIGFISYYKTNDFTLLKFLIILLALKNIKFYSFIRKDYIIRILLFFLIFSLSIFGITEVTTFIRDTYIRYTLGFIHPNTAGFYMMLIAFEYLYINKDKLSIKNILFILMVAIIINFTTYSRTAFLILIMAIISIKLIQKNEAKIIKNKLISLLIKNSFAILTALTILITLMYMKNYSITNKINLAISNRLYYYLIYIINYSVNFMGRDLPNYYPLDSSYLFLLYKFGIIVYLLYYYIYYDLIKKAYKENDYIFIIIILFLLLYGLAEKMIIRSTYNIFLFKFSEDLFRKNAKRAKAYENINYSTNF